MHGRTRNGVFPAGPVPENVQKLRFLYGKGVMPRQMRINA